MCAACGMVTHVPIVEDDQNEPVVNPTTTVKFAALRNPTCRIYLAAECSR